LADVRFSRLAEADLIEIDRYTEGTWGAAQAERYIDGICSFCELLAESPGMGRRWRRDQPASRRIEHGSHVIFYKQVPGGIAVLRILHKRMRPPGPVSR
jgi:toxin ParE1/3/4